jgi:hypothetical protein
MLFLGDKYGGPLSTFHTPRLCVFVCSIAKTECVSECMLLLLHMAGCCYCPIGYQLFGCCYGRLECGQVDFFVKIK